MPLSLQAMRGVHLAALPMACRHGIFDGLFFLTRQTLVDYGVSSPAVQFGASAAVGSAGNLVFDIWKTRSSVRAPERTTLLSVAQSLSPSSFGRQLVVKAAELGGNWFVTGLFVSVSLFLATKSETSSG